MSMTVMRRRNLSPLSNVVQVGIILAIGEFTFASVLRRQLGSPAGDIAYNTAVALIACAYSGYTGAWREIGFRRPATWRTLWWFSPLAFECLYVLHHWHIYAGLWDTAAFALLYVAQSVQARVIYDGLMVRSLLPSGKWAAAVLPAVLQGILIAADFAPVPAEDGFVPLILLILLSTIAMSFAEAALRIRTGILWPLIIIDVATGIVSYLTLTPNASPYPLTLERVAYFTAATLFGLVLGGIALLSVRQRESHQVGVEQGGPSANRSERYVLPTCLAVAVGVGLLVCSFGAFVVSSAVGPPAFQANSQHPYIAARPGTACDSGTGHWWDDDPEERYTCRPDGLQITQLKFDYDGEAYFAFAGDDESSVPFWSHNYWVAVDAQIVGGKPGTCVELHVHVQDFQGRQWFAACNDGTWAVGRCDLHCDKDVQLLSGNLAAVSNRFTLQVHVTDTIMTFLVNGSQVAVLRDKTYTSTDQLVFALSGPDDTHDLPSAVFSSFRYTPVG